MAELFSNSPRPWGRRSNSARHEKLALWSSFRASTVAVSTAPRARGGSPAKLRRISSWEPRSRVNVRLPRGPAPGTLQLRVKFSPTGCQAGSGTSSTRSGRSARGKTQLLEMPGLSGTSRGTQEGKTVRQGDPGVGLEGEDPVTQGAGSGREVRSGVRAWLLRTHEKCE